MIVPERAVGALLSFSDLWIKGGGTMEGGGQNILHPS
jgi:predicted glycosyltransferase